MSAIYASALCRMELYQADGSVKGSHWSVGSECSSVALKTQHDGCFVTTLLHVLTTQCDDGDLRCSVLDSNFLMEHGNRDTCSHAQSNTIPGSFNQSS